MTHQGTANFAVFTLTADNTQADLLANTIGSFSGTVLFDQNEMLGNSTIQLHVTADGPWTLRLAPLSDAPRTGANFSATGPGVFIYDGGSGTAAFNHEGQSNFSVISIDPDGGLFAGMPNLLVNEIGAYSGSVPLTEGPQIVEVGADGPWSMTVS